MSNKLIEVNGELYNGYEFWTDVEFYTNPVTGEQECCITINGMSDRTGHICERVYVMDGIRTLHEANEIVEYIDKSVDYFLAEDLEEEEYEVDMRYGTIKCSEEKTAIYNPIPEIERKFPQYVIKD